MANTISVHQMLARDGAAILEEEAPFLRSINRGRDSDITASVGGYKKGGTVDITIPFTPVVFDGATFAGGSAAPAFTETTVRLALDTQKHTAITVTSVEKALKLESERERIMRPAMQAIGAELEAVFMQRAYQSVANLIGTYGTVPTSTKTYNQARAALNRFLTPMGDRYVTTTSDGIVEVVEAGKAVFNPTSAIAGQYMTGSVGKLAGFEFAESQLVPLHTNGTQATFAVNGASQTGTSLNVKSLTDANTFKKGQTFTIAGVYEVHPITGDTVPGKLRRFVITADVTISGTTGTIGVWPSITPSTATLVGTCSASPAADAVCTSDGAASATMAAALAYHKDAFCAAFAPLELVPGTEGYSATVNGFSVRVMKGGSFTDDTSSTRVDVLGGFAAVRPDHASRIPG